MYFLYNLKGIKEKCENLPFLKNKTIPTNSAKRFGKKNTEYWPSLRVCVD